MGFDEFNATQREFLKQTVEDNPFIPQTPYPKQAFFLGLTCREALYGGAARGGKTYALLMAALQFVHVPNYNALLLRRTFPELNQVGGLIQRSREWLTGKAEWSSARNRWTFPGGATLGFGYLDTDNDVYQYAGTDFHFIGTDELTQFTEWQYTFLFSRLVKQKSCVIPVRMRAGTNPGGLGHAWCKKRFITEAKSKGRMFVPARLEDNPSIDQQDYRLSLRELDWVTRKRLELGDWEVSEEGGLFKRQWFEVVGEAPECRWCRFWDLAATEEMAGHDPDWLVNRRGVRVCRVCRRKWDRLDRIQRRRKREAALANAQRGLRGNAGWAGSGAKGSSGSGGDLT